MKTTLTTLLLFFGLSTQAFACPDLTGVYVCGEDEVTIDTYELSGVNYFEVNGQGRIPADGSWFQLPDSETEKNAKLSMTCGDKAPYGQHFVLNYQADMYDQGQYIALLDAQMYYFLDSDTFVQETTGTVKGSWGEQPIQSQKVVCTRK